jgi:hypothetical protein
MIATDLFRRSDVWLIDIGLEASLEEGAMCRYGWLPRSTLLLLLNGRATRLHFGHDA